MNPTPVDRARIKLVSPSEMACSGRAPLLTLLLVASAPVPAAELITKYQWGSTQYLSLAEAEYALRTASFTGSAYYLFEGTWPNGTTREYGIPNTNAISVGTKVLYWSSPGIGCGDCPIYDQNGFNRCGSSNPTSYCASEASWWGTVQNDTWPPSIGCTIELVGGMPPWGSIYSVANDEILGLKLPEVIRNLKVTYSKTVLAEFTDGPSSICGDPHNFQLYAMALGQCPPGYPSYGSFQGVTGCYNAANARITTSFATPPETNSNSCRYGNPCHPTTGDKSLSETDFVSDSFNLTRHYHSQQAYPDIAGMGRGWSHSYSERVRPEASIIKVVDGKGGAEHFICANSPTCNLYRSKSHSGTILRSTATGPVR